MTSCECALVFLPMLLFNFFTAYAAVASLMAGCNYIGIVQINEDSDVIKKEWARLKDNSNKQADEEANEEDNST